ncbi:DUF1294 domain-containing protein [Pasteurellaceae bacterium 22721_9_1]
MLWFIVIYFAAMNIAAYFLMRVDKQRAQNKEWRIAESIFFSFCFMGGFVGVHLGMQHFHHKTQHWQFKTVVILSAVLFLIVLPIWLMIK